MVAGRLAPALVQHVAAHPGVGVPALVERGIEPGVRFVVTAAEIAGAQQHQHRYQRVPRSAFVRAIH